MLVSGIGGYVWEMEESIGISCRVCGDWEELEIEGFL